MLDIQKSLKLIIERYIAQTLRLTTAASAGDTTVSFESTRRYSVGDKVVVYEQSLSTSNSPKGEVHAITNILSNRTVELDSPLVADYSTALGYVKKLHGFESYEQHVRFIFLGEPAVIPFFPAITINGKSRSSEWFTLESTSETYEIDITVYVQAADYQSQYETMHEYTRAIECSLFRSFYPLVEPYDVAILKEDISHDDRVIRVVDSSNIECVGGWVWFESADYLRWNSVDRNLGNGVFELRFPVGQVFSAGDKIIRPRRHIYNSLPHSTQYGTVNKDGMLKASVISWRCQEEVRRYVPFIDSLTF